MNRYNTLYTGYYGYYYYYYYYAPTVMSGGYSFTVK
jgi:hypothetical protein